MVVFKQTTAYEMRISDWSSDVCSSDLDRDHPIALALQVLHDEVAWPDLPVAGADHRDRLHVVEDLAEVVVWIAIVIHRRAFRKVTVHGVYCPLHSAGRFSRKASMPSAASDRKRVVEGKGVYVRVDLGGRRIIKKKKKI